MGVRPGVFRLDGSFIGLPNNRANRPPPLHLRYDAVSKKKHSDISFPHCRMHATVAGAFTVSPARRWSSPTRQASPAAAFLFGRCVPTLPCCCRVPIPRRLPSRAKPDDASDGGGGGALRYRLRPRRLESHSPSSLMLQVHFKCFKCFVGMFQVFHVDVAKLDWGVAYVAMIVLVCYNCLFPMFHLFFFRHMLQVCLSGCCICFTRILQVFYLDVAYVCNCFSSVFMCFKRMF
jgi:hypothetical protein